jgi:hypothetical protein
VSTVRKPIAHGALALALNAHEFASLFNVARGTPFDFDLDEDVAELTSIIQGMTSRDLQICSRIVLAVIEMNERIGAAATNAALAGAVRDIQRASMI